MYSKVYRDCSVCIDETVVPIGLIPLEMGHFDVIFEIDWLSRNGVIIYCLDKCISFTNAEHK